MLHEPAEIILALLNPSFILLTVSSDEQTESVAKGGLPPTEFLLGPNDEFLIRYTETPALNLQWLEGERAILFLPSEGWKDQSTSDLYIFIYEGFSVRISVSNIGILIVGTTDASSTD